MDSAVIVVGGFWGADFMASCPAPVAVVVDGARGALGSDVGLRSMFLDWETLAGSEICGVPEDVPVGTLSYFGKSARPGIARSSSLAQNS